MSIRRCHLETTNSDMQSHGAGGAGTVENRSIDTTKFNHHFYEVSAATYLISCYRPRVKSGMITSSSCMHVS